MKTFLTYLRASSVALTCAIGLAACGGYSAVTLGGAVSGLGDKTGLVLINGNDTYSVPAGTTTYSFPNQVDIGSTFHVTVKESPPHMTCSMLPDISGTAGTTSSTNINVVCVQITHTVGGTIGGVPAAGITLVNGTDQLPVAAGATTFTMTAPVAEESVYGITVLLPQPTGFNCSIVNGTGIMGVAAVTNVQVTCLPI